MSLIGKKAPLFEATAVVEGGKIVKKFSLQDYIGKKEILLFFYPKDFTFVCPTEILAFQEYLDDFESRNVAVIGCSTDTEECHWAWLNTPVEQGGIEGVKYPIVSDSSKMISYNYDVLAGNWDVDNNDQFIFHGSPIAYRGTFFIDIDGIVRHESINDFPIGRNVEEILRIIDAWKHVEEYGEVCPVNWNKGEKAIDPSQKGIKEYMTHCIETNSFNYNSMLSDKQGCCGGVCSSSTNDCGSDEDEILDSKNHCGSGMCN